MNSLLGDYGSDSEEAEGAGKDETKKSSFTLPEGGDFFSNPGEIEDSSDDEESDGDEDAEDAAGKREAGPAAAPSFLPPVDALFEEVTVPDFLRPEATKPIAVNRKHMQLMKPPPMEHPMLRSGEAGPSAGGAVIGSSAQLYSQEELAIKAAAALAQKEREAAGSGAGAGPGSAAGGGAPGPRRPEEKGAPSRAIAVEEVFANPNMLLPRKRGQDRKDKEKEKRMKGQSAIGSWKSEAEMVLRQQYDS